MSTYYYSTKSSLDWIFGHYFYGRVHYVWLANCFYPYGQSNPKSSNPLLIYQDLYQPWKDGDEYDKFIASSRINLRKGVLSKERERIVSSDEATALCELCDTVATLFFYPLVYRVDIERIATSRRELANSGLRGSSEFLVRDLKEDEFDILFLDFDKDEDFRKIVREGALRHTYLDSYQVRDILEGRRSGA